MLGTLQDSGIGNSSTSFIRRSWPSNDKTTWGQDKLYSDARVED